MLNTYIILNTGPSHSYNPEPSTLYIGSSANPPAGVNPGPKPTLQDLMRML